MTLFHGCVVVDWSAKIKPATGKDSVWLAIADWAGQTTYENPSTRHEAINRIESLLENATKTGRRLLCGFDFPFGFPENTARRLTGRDDWEAVWRRIAQVVQDDERNFNNRFDAAARLNRYFTGEGPFWGHDVGYSNRDLSPKMPRRGWGGNLPRSRRYAECVVPSAQEVWKLWGSGAVGGQALTGIAALERLRRLRGRRSDVEVWPFETLGEGNCHVLAEVYPSLIPPWPRGGVKDQRQVRAVAVALEDLDRSGELRQYLRVPATMPNRVIREEGLFLGLHDPVGFHAAAVRGCGECTRCGDQVVAVDAI